ncbi:MAG: hypothetical protein KDD04_03510, partial [Sinomicrobium sp.]|nr:hypothetical protein [Sinomicrobium sp.]
IHLRGRLSKLPEFFFYKDQAIVSDLYLHFDRLDLDQLMDKDPVPHKNGHKRSDLDRRLEVLCRRLAENVNGQLLLQFDELHYDTFFLTDLHTRLRLFSPHLEQVADSSMIRLDSLSANYMGDTPIYANLQLSADEVPEAAIEVYLPSAVRPARLLLPKDLKIIGGDARVKLNAQAALRAFIQGDGMPADLRYQGAIQFNEMAFQHADMPASITHVSGPVRLDGQQLLLDDLHFNYAGAPLILQGNILHYDRLGQKAGRKALVDLKLKGRKLDLSQNADRRENEKQATISPPKLFRSLGDVFQQATGKINVALDALKMNKQIIHPFLLDAQLLPDTIADQAQYCLQVDSFHLGLSNNSYFKGSAMIKKPDVPYIKADLIGNLQFRELAELLPSEYIEMRSGKLRMDLQYQSPLHDTLNAANYLLDAEMNGHAELIDGELYYNYRDFTFADISGHLRFDQRALYIDDLALKVNGNRLLAEGASSDFFPFFILPDRRANIKLKVSSPYFDFGEFKAPNALEKDRPRKKRQKTGRSYRDTTVVAEVDTVINALQQTAGYIDQLLDRGSLDMSTNFDKVVYEEFSAQEIDGRITLAPDTVQLHNLRMNVANGHLAIAGHISDIIQHEPSMEISVEMDKNNVREIFRQFNNFGQQELGYENIKGIISADLHFTADINSNYNIRPESMHGDLGVKLAGGELIDLKAFHKKSGFLFRNRGLDHVILDTLQLHSHIRGSDLYVDNFYLHSSSFDFGAIGRYSLGADNNTRILLTIPIRNFFRRHISLEEMREGRSERKGMNILLEARHRKDKMRLIWRPFILNKDQFKMEEEKE